jgi:Flp pilus assembly protein TadG
MKKAIMPTSGKRFQPGQALTEFGLAASTLLLALFSIMNMSAAVLGYNTICHAAHEAVRSAIVHGSTISDASAIQAVAINAAADLNLTDSDVTVTFPTDTSVPSQLDAKVVITYDFTVNIPFRSPITFPLTATAQMPVSQ